MEKCDDCIAKHFCNQTGLIDPHPCPAGHYCPSNTTIPKQCPKVSLMCGTFSYNNRIIDHIVHVHAYSREVVGVEEMQAISK